ncbi:MAG: glycosyltransferase [Anaerolineales bacterium]|nr:MAG: glycosyltransferase [Anaerolineales bacterium]
MTTEDSPLMSVVLVTPDCFETIRATVHHLLTQSIRQKLELVIVAPSLLELDLRESDLEGFRWHHVVEVGPFLSSATARAEGIRAATAPLVALAEDHCFPEPGWAEALARAHEGPWAVVGPAIGNANPATKTSWANLLVEYAPWLAPTVCGEMEHLPGHNSCYKRSVLVGYGSELDTLLRAESTLHWDLRSKGERLYLEGAARANHVNYSLFFSWLRLRFHAGRVFAATRAQRWPLWRRWLYVIGGPLIPVVRLGRILRELNRPGRPRWVLPGVLPPLLGGLVIDALGEMFGYALGAGKAAQEMLRFEFHRYLTEADRQTLAQETRAS